jgi:Ala-tRNA(Pro) deacylase
MNIPLAVIDFDWISDEICSILGDQQAQGGASMTCLERLSAYLRENCVSYTIHHHPAAYTAFAIAASEHIPPHTFAKVVMVFIDGRMAMIVVPADTRADLARLAGVIGAHEICLADEREFAPLFPDCEPGAMPPFGNLYGLRCILIAILLNAKRSCSRLAHTRMQSVCGVRTSSGSRVRLSHRLSAIHVC